MKKLSQPLMFLIPLLVLPYFSFSQFVIKKNNLGRNSEFYLYSLEIKSLGIIKIKPPEIDFGEIEVVPYFSETDSIERKRNGTYKQKNLIITIEGNSFRSFEKWKEISNIFFEWLMNTKHGRIERRNILIRMSHKSSRKTLMLIKGKNCWVYNIKLKYHTSTYPDIVLFFAVEELEKINVKR